MGPATGKASAILGTALFLVAAPGVVAGVIPFWLSGWEQQPALLGLPPTRLGLLLIVAGIAVLLDSFARFALQGIGTPAPIAPTKHLVVTGLYRYVRNPMYLAVGATIVGQALYLGNVTLLIYGACFALAVHLFVRGYEEPTLHRTFGADYERFCAHVNRWWPRLHPWRDGEPSSEQ